MRSTPPTATAASSSTRHGTWRRARRLARALALATTTLTVVAGVVAAPAPAQAKVPAVGKIAVVDVQRILMETKAGKRAKRTMESSAKAKQQKLQKKQAKLEADMRKAESLKGQELMAAQQRLQRQYAELQQMMYSLQQDLAAQEAKLLDDMYRKVQAIVKGMATREGYDLVLVRDPGTIIHTGKAFDITDAVIRAYDKKHPR